MATLGGQTNPLLVMVHVYTYVPYTDTVAVADGLVVLLKVVVPGPDACVHTPVPTIGVLAPSDPLISDTQIFWLGPTVAVVGGIK